MAFFKFRKGGDDKTTTAAQPESVEVLRRRAKNRLVGSAILVLIGVIGFPLLVDKRPRPVVVDLPIEIPDRTKVLPLAAPVAPTDAVLAPAPSAPVTESASPATSSVSGRVSETAPPAEPPAKTPAKSAPAAKPAAKPAPVAKPAAKPSTTAAAEGRFVVQVGAFATESRAREARLKLERAGLKNYIQVVETREGRRIRVRAGPFASKAEAERAAEKIKKLDLPVTVLTL